jgi:hypothetical protein
MTRLVKIKAYKKSQGRHIILLMVLLLLAAIAFAICCINPAKTVFLALIYKILG